jgi:hypothetical protein
MKTKTIILLLVGAVILYFGYKYYQQTQSSSESTNEVSDTRVPTISELLGKNYSEEEAKQIIDAVKAGRISTY